MNNFKDHTKLSKMALFDKPYITSY